ncbi:MAG: cyclase family protein [Halobacteriovoraceae bacterium]|nr:cyclase family protein [Halobacteriovoraceae bacterium]
MPYVLSPLIHSELPALWMEGAPYSKANIYQIREGQLPPVNYDAHTLKAHSLTHIEAPSHTQNLGATVDEYFKKPQTLFGKAIVLKLQGNNYKLVDSEKQIFHWEVSLEELKENLTRAFRDTIQFSKLLLTTEYYPLNHFGFHDPNFVLTLSQEAADWLIGQDQFNAYGTSWKSSDFKPGSLERPIHNTLFRKAAIYECLDLQEVPEGIYFFVGFPIRIEKASESPVCPVLFTKEEIINVF